jgi:murein DD-endopeptidase MepM/ murein hydrolase activator NlpD
VLVCVAGVPAAKTATAGSSGAAKGHRRHRRSVHRPLRVTPPLALAHYVFPVVGAHVSYGDTYGAFRSDVPGNWHHGDDIFAPLGTPVVAVATGTINRVGWDEVGGWRLWVRDGAGDEFYYAHLSGYTPADLRSDRVHAGEVIGFVGNTGDAFTTWPHLHFEIHPRQLLHLGYDGAVDPTGYLDHWTHLTRAAAPRPAHPPLPAQPALRLEVHEVWRELLAARHLLRHRPLPAAARPPAAGPARTPAPSPPASAAAALPITSPAPISQAAVLALNAVAALALLSLPFALAFLARRR